jgi:hypothetical protein
VWLALLPCDRTAWGSLLNDSGIPLFVAKNKAIPRTRPLQQKLQHPTRVQGATLVAKLKT